MEIKLYQKRNHAFCLHLSSTSGILCSYDLTLESFFENFGVIASYAEYWWRNCCRLNSCASSSNGKKFVIKSASKIPAILISTRVCLFHYNYAINFGSSSQNAKFNKEQDTKMQTVEYHCPQFFFYAVFEFKNDMYVFLVVMILIEIS